MASYRTEPNPCRLSAGTYPWTVICDQDGWSMPCRTLQDALRHCDTLNTADHGPVTVADGPPCQSVPDDIGSLGPTGQRMWAEA